MHARKVHTHDGTAGFLIFQIQKGFWSNLPLPHRIHALFLFPDLSDGLFFRSGKFIERKGLEQITFERFMVRSDFKAGNSFPII